LYKIQHLQNYNIQEYIENKRLLQMTNNILQNRLNKMYFLHLVDIFQQDISYNYQLLLQNSVQQDMLYMLYFLHWDYMFLLDNCCMKMFLF
jgi:hypothetical protein